VAISLTAFAVILVWNLLGGVVYLFSGVGKVEGVKGLRGSGISKLGIRISETRKRGTVDR